MDINNLLTHSFHSLCCISIHRNFTDEQIYRLSDAIMAHVCSAALSVLPDGVLQKKSFINIQLTKDSDLGKKLYPNFLRIQIHSNLEDYFNDSR